MKSRAGIALAGLAAVFFLLPAGIGAASPAQGFVDQYGKGSKLITVSYLLQSTDAHRRVNRIELQQRRAGGWVKRISRPVRLDAEAKGRYRLDWRYPTDEGKVETRLQLFGGSKPIAATEPRVVHQPGAPFRAKAVTIGVQHTCAIRLDDRLACWGWDYGLLGDGRERDLSVVRPMVIWRAGRVIDVSTNYEHTCVVRLNHVAACWGSNISGQVGGQEFDERTPRRVKGAGRVTNISAGFDHTCAVRVSGRGICWGSGTSGSLGHGDWKDRSHPVLVRNLESAADIEVGYETSCALKRGFRLVCWGTNEPRIFGKHWRIKVPSRVNGLRRALQVEVEQFYGCAIRLDRRVVCWGENRDGRVGDGTRKTRLKPTLVKGVGKVRSISSYWYGSCAIDMKGLARCWGTAGRQGPGSSEVWDRARLLSRHVRFRSIEGNADEGCGIARTRILWCWGDNSFGKLGNGTTLDQLAPKPVLSRMSRSGSLIRSRTTTRFLP